MKTAINLQTKIPREIRVFTFGKTNPFISSGVSEKVRLKGIMPNFKIALQSEGKNIRWK